MRAEKANVAAATVQTEARVRRTAAQVVVRLSVQVTERAIDRLIEPAIGLSVEQNKETVAGQVAAEHRRSAKSKTRAASLMFCRATKAAHRAQVPERRAEMPLVVRNLVAAAMIRILKIRETLSARVHLINLTLTPTDLRVQSLKN